MKNKQLPTKTGTLSYGENLAHSLLLYAETNEIFASWLHSVLESECTLFKEEKQTHIITSVKLLTLINEYTAVRRSEWLLQMLLRKNLPHSEKVLQILSSWFYSYEETEPRAAILGLKYGILNFGIWGLPGKRNEPIDILVRNDISKNITSTKLSKECVMLTHSIVEKGLIFASGNSKLLEPELADWLFGEKNIVIHTADTQTLGTVENELLEIDAPYVTKKDEAEVTFLAIPPTVYIQNLASAKGIELFK